MKRNVRYEKLRIDTRIAKYKCSCGKELEAGHAIGEPGATPVPGSILLCMYCYTLHKWDVEGNIHAFTDEDYVEIKRDPMTWFKIQMNIDAIKRQKGQRNGVFILT